MERKLELLLIEDDAKICDEFMCQISNSDELLLLDVTNNATKAVEYIKEYLPDAVILDLELHQGGGNGLFVLQAINNMALPRHPYILITTNNSSAYTYRSARALGADFIMSKHQEGYSTAGVLDFLRIMKTTLIDSRTVPSLGENTTETPEKYERRIRRQIMKELNLVGISPKFKGYTYLTDAIFSTMKSSSGNICSIIADKYEKSQSSIERAMQNAINHAWKTNNIEDLLLHYTARIRSDKGSPTITEFICYYASKLKNEY